MTITIDTAADALGSDPLADPDGIMKPHGRELVRTELAHWRQRNLRGHVLAVGKGDPFGTVDDIDALWKRLHYVDDHDLFVVVAQGRGYVARGWNQTTKGPSRSGTLADEAISIVRELGGHVRPSALAPSSGTTLQRPAPPSSSPSGSKPSGAEPVRGDAKKDDGGSVFWPVFGGTVLVVGGGLVALAIRRRGKLAKEGLAKIGAAKSSLERVYSDVILACEELPGDPQATDIQLKATELKKRADQVVAEVEEQPHTGNDPVVLGKLDQLENELGALRSTVLQKRTQPAGLPEPASASAPAAKE